MSLSLPTLGELGQPRARRQGGLPVDIPPSLLTREMRGTARFTSGFFRGILELTKLPFTTGAALVRGEAPSKLPPVRLATGIAKSAFETGRDVGRLATASGRSELAEKIRNHSLVEVVGEDALNILGASKLAGVGLRRALGRTTPLTRALEAPVRTGARTLRQRVSRPALARAIRGEPLTRLERAITFPERRFLAKGRVRPEIIEGLRETSAAASREANVAQRTVIATIADAIKDAPIVTPLLRGVRSLAQKDVIQNAVGEALTDLSTGTGQELARLARTGALSTPEIRQAAYRRFLPEDATSFVDPKTGLPIPELANAKYQIRAAIVTDPDLARLATSKLAAVERVSQDLLSLAERAEDIRVGVGGKPRIGEEIKVGELIFSRKDVNTRIRPALARTDPTVMAQEGRKFVVSETEVANRARALLEGGRLAKESTRVIRHIFEQPALRNVPARLQPIYHSTRRFVDDLRAELKSSGMSDKQVRQVFDDMSLPRTFTEVIQRTMANGADPIFIPDVTRAQANRYLFGHATLGPLIGRLGEVVTTGRAKPRARILAAQGRVVQNVADAFDAAMTEVVGALRSNEVAKLVDDISFDIPVLDRQTPTGAVVREKTVPPDFQAWDPVSRVAGTDASFVRQPHVTKMIPRNVADELNRWSKPFEPVRLKGYDTMTDAWRTSVLTLSPRWYVNGLVGNILLAKTQGVRLIDFAAAWRTLREGGKPFGQARRAPEGFLASFFPGGLEATGARGRLGTSTLISAEFAPFLKGPAGSTPAVINKTLRQISQANFFIDEIARVSAFKSLRRKGQTIEEAVRGSNRMMVDYMDMTPIQRAYVRRVIPFFCVPDDVEVLTRDGWKQRRALRIGDELLTNNEAGYDEWQPLLAIHQFPYSAVDGPLHRVAGRFPCTANHEWPVETKWGTRRVKRAAELSSDDWLIQVVDDYRAPASSILSPRDAAILGWIITDGHIVRRGNYFGCVISQTEDKHLAAIRKLLGPEGGIPTRTGRPSEGQSQCWQITVLQPAVRRLREAGWRGRDSSLLSVVTRLDSEAIDAMWQAMLDADGSVATRYRHGKVRTQIHFAKRTYPIVEDTFQLLSLLRGMSATKTRSGLHIGTVRRISTWSAKPFRSRTTPEPYEGIVWCPEVANRTVYFRFDGRIVRSRNSWQKGILKVASRLPIDHPVRVAAYHLAGKTLGGWTDEERRNYPAFMFHSVPLSTFGPLAALFGAEGDDRLMTRGANPFADALSLITPEGILSSINPFADWVGRWVFNKPSETNIWMQKLDVSTGGFLVPEFDMWKEGLLIFRDLPISRLVIQATEQDARVRSGKVSPLLPFAGINIRTREEVLRAIERQLKSAEAAAGTQAAAERREAGLTRPGGRRRRSTGLPTLAELGAPRGR